MHESSFSHFSDSELITQLESYTAAYLNLEIQSTNDFEKATCKRAIDIIVEEMVRRRDGGSDLLTLTK